MVCVTLDPSRLSIQRRGRRARRGPQSFIDNSARKRTTSLKALIGSVLEVFRAQSHVRRFCVQISAALRVLGALCVPLFGYGFAALGSLQFSALRPEPRGSNPEIRYTGRLIGFNEAINNTSNAVGEPFDMKVND